MTRIFLALGTVVMCGAIAALIVAEPLVPDKPAQEKRLRLTAVEREGSVLLDWDNKAQVIQAAASAALDITDGGIPQRRPVDMRTLRLGGLAYRRRSPELVLRLLVFDKHSVLLAQPSVRLTGPAPVLPEP